MLYRRTAVWTLLLASLLLPAPSPASVPHLVADLSIGGTGGEPAQLTVIDDRVFYISSDADGTLALRVTDTNTLITTRLVDLMLIYDGYTSFSLTKVGSTLFFLNMGAAGAELWKSDGTPAGTVSVKALYGLVDAAKFLTDVAGTLFFAAYDPAGGFELWTSDGTEAGTVPITDFATNQGIDRYQLSFSVIGGELYFAATDAAGNEPWKSDGTPAGTARIADINPGAANSNPAGWIELDGTIYFAATEPTGGYEMWKTDGSEAGTSRAFDLVPGPGNGNSVPHAILNGKLFFEGTDGTNTGAWLTDGTLAGTQFLAPSVYPSDFATAGGLLFYGASGAGGRELWRSDGTPAGTFYVDIRPGSTGSSTTAITAFENGVVFSAYEPTHGEELWTSDGSIAGTTLVKDIWPQAASGSTPANLVPVNGEVWFVATGPDLHREIWRTDATSAGTGLAVDLVRPGSASSDLSDLTPFGNGLAFVLGGNQAWTSDGKSARQASFVYHDANSVAVLDDQLYYAGAYGLWTDDGFTNVQPEMNLQGLTTVAGALYYTDGFQVFRSDGTPGGAVSLVTILGGTGCAPGGCVIFPSRPRSFTAIGSNVFFIAAAADGMELWKTDGTPAGTIELGVFALPPGVDFLFRDYPLVASNRLLFFRARPVSMADPDGFELWKSDGTAAGTVLVQDINPGTADSNPGSFADLGGTLLFAADDGSGGRELWRSDGSGAGTARVADIDPGAVSSSPTELTAHAGRVYFAATDSAAGRELWWSDGSSASRVADIRPGSGDSNPSSLLGTTDALIFAADDGSAGREPWASDGTAAGTSRIYDIEYGSSGSNPAQFTKVGDRVLFAARTALTGNELWVMDEELPLCALQTSDAAACAPEDPDSDADGICDVVDPCTNVAQSVVDGARVRIKKLGAPFGDETLSVQGKTSVASMPPIDPDSVGLRVRVTRAGGTVLADLAIPAGLFDSVQHRGWTEKSAGERWQYVCGSEVSAKVSLDAPGSGDLRFKVIAKKRPVDLLESDLPLAVTVVVDAPVAESNQCGETAFTADGCGLNASGTTISCQ